MIRYVLAVMLTIALLVLSVPAIDHAAAIHTERQAAGEITDLDSAATALLENEELAHDGAPSPQRTVTITFPDDSLTSTPIDRLRIERVSNRSSVATVTVDGRESRFPIDAPIVDNTEMRNETVDLGGVDEDLLLVLRLERDQNGLPVISIGHA
jgi:hypothetical protein